MERSGPKAVQAWSVNVKFCMKSGVQPMLDEMNMDQNTIRKADKRGNGNINDGINNCIKWRSYTYWLQ